MKITDKILELDSTPWRLYEPEGGDSEWCVLWLQGFRSNIEGHAVGVTRLADSTNTAFAMLDYAGHGGNPIQLEDATRKQQFDEVVGVYDELVKLGYKKFIVIGGSFGSYMAALLIGARSAEAVVLRAPANYPDEEFELANKDTSAGRKDRSHYLYRQSIDDNFSNNAVEAVRAFEGETYVIEHEKDETINRAIPQSYYRAAKHGNYILIPGIKHSPKLMSNPEGYFELIEMWVSTIVKAVQKNQQLQG